VGGKSTLEASAEIARLLSALSRSSSMCFVIVDEDLRFRAVNHASAAFHCLPVEDHLGKKLVDITGELGMQAQPALKQVLTSARPLHLETVGRLPHRTDAHSWVNHFFPIETARRKARQVGLLAVEVTELNRLDELYTNLTAQLLPTATPQQLPLLRELHVSIGEYKAALGLNLASLSNATRDPERTVELFTHSMQRLDQRMAELTSAIAGFFPLGPEQ
jgi:transcriptional regulator with PAS, ATPase and Fis domain